MSPGLVGIDFLIIGLYLLCAIAVGAYFSRRASTDLENFFLGGRNLPWWLAGTSMVATTFAADTPLAVTGLVAADGISGNWIWWNWAIAHLAATFFFARLWRRSGVLTDAEIVELRYGGRAAAVLRAFKAIYFGLFVNCLTMAWVIAAMVKITRSFFSVEPVFVIAVCLIASVAYTTLGGLRSVVVTDLVQFAMGVVGALALAWFVLADFGGVGALSEPASTSGEGLLGALESSVGGSAEAQELLGFLPSGEGSISWIYFVVLLVAGWWRLAEGQGYIVQRLASCRSEGEAQGASLWFAIAHNALRPWPWILVALAALVVYPRAEPAGLTEGTSFPERSFELALPEGAATVVVSPGPIDLGRDARLVVTGLPSSCRLEIGGEPVPGRSPFELSGWRGGGELPLEAVCGTVRRFELGSILLTLDDREMAYPLMMRRNLPSGILGLVVASLLAAFMSTIDTHTNWGASYLVRDLYQRFVKRDAAPAHYVTASRIAIVLIAVLAGSTALFIQNIATVWRFLITLGAGLGSVTALRWYWPRVTAHAELAALGATTLTALGLELGGAPRLLGGTNPFFVTEIAAWAKILIVAAVSLTAWLPTAIWGPQNDRRVLEAFARKVRPAGPGWRPYVDSSPDRAGAMLTRFAAGLVVVFGSLFGIGFWILGAPGPAGLCTVLAVAGLVWVVRSDAA